MMVAAAGPAMCVFIEIFGSTAVAPWAAEMLRKAAKHRTKPEWANIDRLIDAVSEGKPIIMTGRGPAACRGGPADVSFQALPTQPIRGKAHWLMCSGRNADVSSTPLSERYDERGQKISCGHRFSH
jgi:hypothetical protein